MIKSPFQNMTKLANAGMNAISPLNKNEIHEGIEGIIVKLLDYPDEQRMKKLLSKMVKATIGSDPSEDIPDEVGEELFKGGLQTGLKAFMVSFEISGVSRSFTHQFVRTSQAMFHQQSSRYTFMGDKFNVRMPESIASNPDAKSVFEKFVDSVRLTYTDLCALNIPFQDARFVCPIGLETYIVAEFPLKVFIDTYAYRACCMMQWEITYVFKEMRKLLVEKFPWMDEHIKISCEKIKRCTFQGWESTDICELPWKDDRIFKSKHFGEK